MEKKFLIIMAAIIVLLTITIGALVVINPITINLGESLPFGNNRDANEGVVGEITTQGAEETIDPTTTQEVGGDTDVRAPELQLDVERIEFGGLTWRVLDERDGKTFVISEYVLEFGTFHYEQEEITWADSDIRRWLNGEFYNRFTESERIRIAKTHLINHDNQWFGTPGGQDTTDKIFLLSLEELVRYFGDSGQLSGQLTGTPDYLHGWGFNDEFYIYREAYLLGFDWEMSWLLRSPGSANYYVAESGFDGVVVMYGMPVSFAGGIRPAMWIYL